MTPKPHEQEFEFDGTFPQRIGLRRAGVCGGPWLNAGALRNLAPEHVEVSRTTCFYNDSKEDVCREVTLPQWWDRRLERIADAVRSRLYPESWRALAPNLVLHHSFGPGFTVATDGVHVILFDCPQSPTVWLEVQRGNVVGPVTSVPTGVREWDGSEQTSRRAKSLRQRILDEL